MELEGFRFSEEPTDIEKDSNNQFVVTFPTYKDCKKKNEEKECIGESNICVYCYYSSFLILMVNQLPSKRKAFVEYQVGWRVQTRHIVYTYKGTWFTLFESRFWLKKRSKWDGKQKVLWNKNSDSSRCGLQTNTQCRGYANHSEYQELQAIR